MSYSFHREGDDAKVDTALAELRNALDQLKQMKIEEWGVAP